MFESKIHSSLPHLESRELVPLLLETSDDLTHEVALHAVRLDHDVGALHFCCVERVMTCGKASSRILSGCVLVS